MELKSIAKHVDHTLLAVTATWREIQTTLDLAVKYGAASACIPPSYVKEAVRYVGEILPICTVVGFPSGYSTTASKVYETKAAIAEGAKEVDMVINIGWLKDKRYEDIKEEIEEIRKASIGNILKVIIETSLLEDSEKIEMAKIVSGSGADYIKTSTGFAGGGATAQDIMLLAGNIGHNLKIKASGGINSLEDAERFISLGADRLGSSKVLNLLDKIYG